ncbi:MAG: double-strand break repair protein AddB [Rhodospirillales bacterium]
MSTDRVRDTLTGLFSIPSDRPFVDDLAHGILRQSDDDPMELARFRILLPTRRACRSLREAFLRIGGGAPRLLPRMIPIGDVDEDDLILEIEGSIGGGPDAPDIPPAIGTLRRQLILTELVRQRDPDSSPDQCALLARELARLMDQVATERLDFAGLQSLAGEQYAEHWQKVLRFLEIVTENWPSILAEEGAIDPADRRNRLLEVQAALWRERPPDTPVIAAGSTGSIPATADLLAVVASLPKGAVVLPGLDRTLDATAWAALNEGHPQSGLGRLLVRLGVERDDVADWPAPADAAPRRQARAELLSSALKPPAAIVQAVTNDGIAADALDGVTRIECPEPAKEAEVIALAMRETLETPARTAALVTPDRDLARRVAAELRRWNIAIDDSAGQPLGQTEPGAFVRLTAALLTGDFGPVELLSTLKHPLAAGGRAVAEFRRLARLLEMAALRGPRPAPGWEGLKRALTPGHDTLSRWIDELTAMTRPLTNLATERAVSLKALVRAHVNVVEALATDETSPGAANLWAGDAGEALALFFAELGENHDMLEAIRPREYAPLLDTLMQGRVVRPRFGRHPRLNIWGPLEARLQHADVLILGGLNEGTWPSEPDPGPWMSRPMMNDFGLPPPERRIGLSAHDFTQAFAAPNVLLTRAARAEGAPTVANRWLQRLEVQVSDSPLAKAFAPDTRYLALADALDRPATGDTIEPAEPSPRPRVADRPRRLSVTRIETWLRDPYAIYARYILNLKPIDPIDAEPTAAERGTLIHMAVERFVADTLETWPDNPYQRLIEIGRDVFAPHLDRLGVRTFWWPRFERIAAWFVENEVSRRANGMMPLAVEAKGAITVGDDFTLTGTADRIDRLVTGRLAVVDYKTGQPPGKREVETGLAPQLPLEAAMIRAGGFPDLPDPPPAVERLDYWQLSGGREVAKMTDVSSNDAEALAERALQELTGWVRRFDDEEMPYRSRRWPKRQEPDGDYDHLARVREWAGGDDDGGDGE